MNWLFAARVDARLGGRLRHDRLRASSAALVRAAVCEGNVEALAQFFLDLDPREVVAVVAAATAVPDPTKPETLPLSRTSELLVSCISTVGKLAPTRARRMNESSVLLSVLGAALREVDSRGCCTKSAFRAIAAIAARGVVVPEHFWRMFAYSCSRETIARARLLFRSSGHARASTSASADALTRLLEATVIS